ncbi:MAG: PAS domain S-box protein [Deltaproteobacteria bacterium]|nr:PAS domain S-box protein [Deltaproteobacteria bacterium]
MVDKQDASHRQTLAGRQFAALPGLTEFWQVFEHVDAAVAVTDCDSTFQWANRAYCDLTGYALQDLVGRKPSLLRSNQTSAEAIRALWDALGSCGRYRGRLVNRRADGSLFHADLSLVKVNATSTNPGYILATMRDVTLDHQMEERLSQLARQATEARDSTILALASLAEQRDRTTGRHLQRIEAYTAHLARWTKEQRAGALPEWLPPPDVIGRCAMLHDIGKVGIPDAILLKPGRLDEAEQAVMRQHPRLGADIIDRVLAVQPESVFLRVARDIVLHHHEAWDGTGYPHGAVRDAIPVHAQLAIVADVFDALTSERPYKKAASVDEAFAWITARAGAQFSPLAVEALGSMRGAFVELHRQLGDPPGTAAIEASGVQRPAAPAPAPDRAPLPPPAQPGGAVVRRVLAEAMENAHGGEVVVRSAKDVGRIYVFQGRVAWAHATCVRGVLTDRLLEEGLPPAEVGHVVQECRREGRNLGEVLVSWGLLSEQRFREILRIHVRERVHAIEAYPDPIAMFVPQRRKYAGRFTFTLDELR